jgi:hypothetical protein
VGPEQFYPEDEEPENDQIKYQVKQFMVPDTKIPEIEVGYDAHGIMVNDHHQCAESEDIENLYQDDSHRYEPYFVKMPARKHQNQRDEDSGNFNTKARPGKIQTIIPWGTQSKYKFHVWQAEKIRMAVITEKPDNVPA